MKSGPRFDKMIQSDKVRVIDHEGENLGVMYTREAIEQAADVGLNLVEVSPNADPPGASGGGGGGGGPLAAGGGGGGGDGAACGGTGGGVSSAGLSAIGEGSAAMPAAVTAARLPKKCYIELLSLHPVTHPVAPAARI